jgi:hypothetical protein
MNRTFGGLSLAKPGQTSNRKQKNVRIGFMLILFGRAKAPRVFLREPLFHTIGGWHLVEFQSFST